MRFHSLALASAALLGLSSFSHNGFARADEAAVADATPLSEDSIVGAETVEFQAEVSRILDIVVNSLYQNKDVFLRELISNASDALDKMRFLSITKPEMLADKAELEIRISYDEEAKTLTITDSGVGMTKQDLIDNLGTVARSGTTQFMDKLAEGADVDQIGMFGVGFYSAFLVSNKVVVASKNPSEDTQHVWISGNGDSSFSVAEDPRGNTLGRGTEITLYLKEDAEEYAEYERLASMVNHYSEFITHPIFVRETIEMEVPDEDAAEESESTESTDEEKSEDDEFEVSEEEDADAAEEEEKPVKMKKVTTHSWTKANADAAIWNRSKEDVTDEEYQSFFHLIAQTDSNATSWSHFDAEGNINFKSLVYLPTDVPDTLKVGDISKAKSAMKLYVRKVLISDDFELLPKYMSFITGVVDSDDLPLNVNRETLQESKIISIIRKKTTRKVLDMIKKLTEEPMPEPEFEDELDDDGEVIGQKEKEVVHPYIEWYEKFHPSIKMGVMDDESNRKRISKLVRVKTSKSDGKYISFEDYVSHMKEWQKDIYFIAGTDLKELEKSPFMEKFNEKDVEVIYFTEPADEYMVGHLVEFDGKKFVTIGKEGISLESDEEKDEAERRHKVYTNKFKPLTKFLNKFYGTRVMSVTISKRLGSVPAIVSSSAYGQSANMERIMRAQAFAHNQNDGAFVDGMRTLEINPRHPFIDKLFNTIDLEGEPELSQDVKDSLWNLLDTALLNGGFPISEGKAFTNRMMRSIKTLLDVESMKLLPEIDVPLEEDVPPSLSEEAESKAKLQEVVDHLDQLGHESGDLPEMPERPDMPDMPPMMEEL
mmetsp:Transcript_1724/g.2472  ORF Transcript_1724/g.2472 Transcript_1724/m.2472 type:complete len:825 (-) Transcript_1724:76-2550(-)|eukprot:CAMPEP_0203662230 /NCGR_PEP_ID=MMETSP0090-20130426/263_1 /ASSEMBLY_ACC=CAM_ASM_001088 /TAXON_ID=426623 /ORGANISM="Chaetoceros affinis, Strain CCMP159" /LENGTH=824 /DNA_ID=CAMNT_0050524991 /DNA_START=46 /DNA_END=2520 /DNA_ORIENTATION=+